MIPAECRTRTPTFLKDALLEGWAGVLIQRRQTNQSSCSAAVLHSTDCNSIHCPAARPDEDAVVRAALMQE